MVKLKYIFLILFTAFPLCVFSQGESFESYSLPNQDTITATDSLSSMVDTSSVAAKPPSSVIDAPIDYNAKDSISISMEEGQQIVHLYGEAIVTYGSIELTAGYIQVNLQKKEIYAEGITDTLGDISEKPHFKESGEEFDCKNLRYNFETGKGFVENVVTEQQDGIVHSEKAKMMNKDEYCMVDGKFSACDAEHPHYYLAMTKAKVIKDKSIVTGRAYLVLLDFPLYFPFLPYGLIPTYNNEEYASGIIMPSFTNHNTYGFGITDGGFYWAINDYLDFQITGDVYTSGKWSLSATSKYKKRYKYNGTFTFGYSNAVSGLRGIDQIVTPQINITWSHSLDSKSNPSSSFSASVNFSSSGYDKSENYDDPTKVVQNTKKSSITYRKSFGDSPFSFTAYASITQNTKDSSIVLTFPSATFTMKTIQPFKRKKEIGAGWFYKNVVKPIKIGYTGSFSSSLSTTESEFFPSFATILAIETDWERSLRHSIPITLPSFSLMNCINITPSINFDDRTYFDYTEEYWVDGYSSTNNDGVDVWVPGHVESIQKQGLGNYYSYSFSLGTSTTLYGMYNFKNPDSKVVAIRHKVDPTLSFSYSPDFTDVERFPFCRLVQTDSIGTMEKYNVFEGSSPSSKSGSIIFALGNNVEMKVKNDADTTSTDKYKKITLIDNLSFSGSYDLAAKEKPLGNIALKLRTKIYGKSFSVSGTLNPYALDEKGSETSTYCWTENFGHFGRITRLSTSTSFSLTSDKLAKMFDKKSSKEGESENSGEKGKSGGGEKMPINSGDYVPFDMPWNVSVSYSLAYTNTKGTPRITQSANFSGSLDISDKWSSNFSASFDFDDMAFTNPSLSITRNLHCWTMSLRCSPFGASQYYTFKLVANSALVSDFLKVERKEY